MPKLISALAGLGLLGLSGCTNQDPLYRPGTWHATGVNDHNLQAMVANPYDLEAGVGSPTDRGNSGARAATRLLVDRRRPLLNAAIGRFGTSAAQDDTPLPTGSQGGASNAAQ